MSPKIKTLVDTFDWNTRFVAVGLADLSNEDAGRRWRDGQGSSITYLTGHCMSSRVGLLKRFGETEDNPYGELFGAEAEVHEPGAYPAIDQLASEWNEVAERLSSTLASLTEEQVMAPVKGFPIADPTARGALMFLAWHESYHVGQIGLMRTELGYPSMQARFKEAMRR
ncbi:MAG: DinB family protein [Acidobacteriota bacterium]